MKTMRSKKNEPLLWVGHHSEDGKLVVDWSERLSKNLRRGERTRHHEESIFRRAPFPLYGLPSSWEGARRLGGSSYGKAKFRREVIKSLGLVHGSNVWGEGSSLSVETAIPDGSLGGGVLRCIAEELWFGRATTVQEAIDAQGNLPRRIGERESLPIPSRREVVVPVEGRLTRFDTLLRSAEWVGHSRVGGYGITIEGYQFDPDSIQVVKIVDLEPYILGGR